jgi:hypothetical protein
VHGITAGTGRLVDETGILRGYDFRCRMIDVRTDDGHLRSYHADLVTVLLLDEIPNGRGLDQCTAAIGGPGTAAPGQSAKREMRDETVSGGDPNPEALALKDILAAIGRVHGIRSRLETEAAIADRRAAQFLLGPVADELQLLEDMLGQERDRASAEPS